jgi:DNA-binding transcriptional regulator YhcF (GntR family)
MRFWITKNSELSVREQLVRQVQLGILSEDLPPGYKLPSIRAVARRHRIHANTVSAAYHDLLTQKWLELRRGSGLYVLPLYNSGDLAFDLNGLLAKLLEQARAHGYQPEDVLQKLTYLLHPCKYERVLIAEPRAPMREILTAELEERLGIAAGPFTPADHNGLRGSVIVALPSQAAEARASLPPDVLLLPLRLRSVQEALAGQSRPSPDTVVAIVSKSAELRQGARAMLIAVGLEPECLNDVDAGRADWRERLGQESLIITDIARARDLPPERVALVFRVIADSSIAQLKQLCGG